MHEMKTAGSRKQRAFTLIERLARPTKPLGRRRSSGAFTLIELLVVIGIIGILMALLMPALGGAKKAAMRSRASSEVSSLETAVAAYLSDYGKFPLQPSVAGDITYSSESSASNPNYVSLIKILRADTRDQALLNLWNPRRNLYLQVKESSIVGGAFKDPWDNDYLVRADGNFDNKVQYIPTGTGAATRDILGRSVIVWSKGAKLTDAMDNIKSFEE